MDPQELEAIKKKLLSSRILSRPVSAEEDAIVQGVKVLIAALETAQAKKTALRQAVKDRIKGLEAYMRDFPSDQFVVERLDNWREFRSLMEAE